MCLNDTVNMISFRTSVNISCLIYPVRFWIHITKILVIHIPNNTFSDEPTVSFQSSLQFLQKRLPIIILQRVEEHFLHWEKPWWLLCACVQTKELYRLILRICMAQRAQRFLGILCCLWFFVVSDCKDDLLDLHGLMYFITLVALEWSFLACW